MSRTGDYRGGGYRSNVYRDRARERAPRQSEAAKVPRPYLFLDTDGAFQSPTGFRRVAANILGPDGKPVREMLSVFQRFWFDRSTYWWLVRCDSAAEGRGIIADSQTYSEIANGRDDPEGRILAHGSRAPREAGKP